MKKFLLSLALIFLPLMLKAQALPALYDVTDVASNDVLYIRANPQAGATALGELPHDAKAVEVVAISPDGKWGQVSWGEVSGWASLAYLTRPDQPDWFTLGTNLTCYGTEPFWSFATQPASASARFSTPDQGEAAFQTIQSFPGNRFNNLALLQMAEGRVTHIAVLRGEACSDGMSDRSFGISAQLFLGDPAGGPIGSPALSGCCSLAH